MKKAVLLGGIAFLAIAFFLLNQRVEEAVKLVDLGQEVWAIFTTWFPLTLSASTCYA